MDVLSSVFSLAAATDEGSFLESLLADLLWFAAGFACIGVLLLTGVLPLTTRSTKRPGIAGGKRFLARAKDAEVSPKGAAADAICSASTAGKDAKVVALWESERALESKGAGRVLPFDALRAVSQALARERPLGAVDELAAYAARAQEGSMQPYAMLEGLARGALRPDLARQLAEKLAVSPEKDARSSEILIGGFASVGDVGTLQELLKSSPAIAKCRVASALVRGLARTDLRALGPKTVGRVLLSLSAHGFSEGAFAPSAKAVSELLQAASTCLEILDRILEALQACNIPFPTDSLMVLLTNCLQRQDVQRAGCLETLLRGRGTGSLPFVAFDPLLKLYAQVDSTKASQLLKEFAQQPGTASEGFLGGIIARCADPQSVWFAEEVLAYAQSRSITSLALYKTMMKVYASCGQFEKACDLHGPLLRDGLEPDQVMYGCLVKFAVKSGRKLQSQEWLERATRQQSGATVQSYMWLIKAAGRDGEVDRAFELFERLKNEQGAADATVYNAMLDIFLMHKAPDRAHTLWEEMEKAHMINAVSYNTMIKGLVLHGDRAAGHRKLEEMKARGLKPDGANFNFFLGAAVTAARYEEVWSIVDEMDRSGILLDHYSASILMKVARKATSHEDVERALATLDREHIRICEDDVLLNTALDALVRCRDIKRLARAVQEFKGSNLRPSIQTVGLLIRSFGALKDLESCWDLWRQTTGQRGLVPDDVTLSCMLDALVSSGRVDEAMTLFEEWKAQVKPNTVMYATLMKGCAARGKTERARELHREMQAGGIPLNLIAYTTLIDVHSRAGNLEEATALLAEMEKEGCPPNTITYSALVRGLCLQGDLDRAMELLQAMIDRGVHPDIILLNTLLDGCVRHSRFQLADQLIAELPKYKVEPSCPTISIMVKMWGKRRRLDLAVEVVRTQLRTGRGIDAQVTTSLISACFFNRSPDRALEVFEEMKANALASGPDVTAYDTLICGLATHGRSHWCHKAVELLEEAVSRSDLRPLQPQTVSQLSSVLASAGLTEELGGRVAAAWKSGASAGGLGGAGAASWRPRRADVRGRR